MKYVAVTDPALCGRPLAEQIRRVLELPPAEASGPGKLPRPDMVILRAKELSDKFGGRENIVEIVQKGSRVIVTVKDPVAVDKDEISRSLDSVMFMSNKIVFVIGTKSEQFKALLEENVGKSK